MTDELNKLQAEAAAIDAEFIPAGEPSAAEQETAAMDFRAEALCLINFAVTLFVPIFPSLEKIYTEQTRGNLATVSAPLMEKYNLSISILFEKWGAEINFAMVALPLAIVTSKAIKADMAAAKTKAAAPAAEPQEGAAMGHPSMAAPEPSA